MTASPRELMEAALEVARLASLVALRYYRDGVAIETKADGSPVTLADRAAEQVAREWIHARFPADGILGEEFGETPGASGRRWVLDPVDGTKSFVRGVPLWGTCVAVCEGDTVLAGAAAYPAVEEHVAAAPGEGCWHNGARCTVSAIGILEAATVLITDTRKLTPAARAGWEQLSAQAAVSRGWGDCYGYLLVATGRAEVMADPVLSAWDAAPFLPIIEEAGGVFTGWNGRRDPFAGDAVATNGALARQTRTILGCGTPSH
ncbi:MAG: histidinol phosphate phosphatase [Gemmatimonadetes bacterium]|nr:histidinol phosphate phosphatase [Gemmatimonadota bacterium]